MDKWSYKDIKQSKLFFIFLILFLNLILYLIIFNKKITINKFHLKYFLF